MGQDRWWIKTEHIHTFRQGTTLVENWEKQRISHQRIKALQVFIWKLEHCITVILQLIQLQNIYFWINTTRDYHSDKNNVQIIAFGMGICPWYKNAWMIYAKTWADNILRKIWYILRWKNKIYHKKLIIYSRLVQ